MRELCGRWKWICEVKRRRRGHCTGLLEGINRRDSLRECLIELNLEFDILFYFRFLMPLVFLSIQVCTWCKNESIEFMSLEELKEPRVKHVEGERGYEW